MAMDVANNFLQIWLVHSPFKCERLISFVLFVGFLAILNSFWMYYIPIVESCAHNILYIMIQDLDVSSFIYMVSPLQSIIVDFFLILHFQDPEWSTWWSRAECASLYVWDTKYRSSNVATADYPCRRNKDTGHETHFSSGRGPTSITQWKEDQRKI